MNYLLVEEEDFFIPDELYELVRRNKSIELDAYLRAMSYANMALLVVEERKEELVSLLIVAALHGYDDVVRVLLTHDPTRKQVELEGRVYSVRGDLVNNTTALWCALDRAHYTVARTLIEIAEADVNHGPMHSLLIDSVMEGRLDSVHFLVENGYADINGTEANDNYKGTCLKFAAYYGHPESITYFLAKGAEIDYKTGLYQSTPLCFAAARGHLDSVGVLCWAGASNLKDKNGKTPLTLAAEYHHSNIVDFLLEHNCDEASFNELDLVASSYMVTVNNGGLHERLDRMRYLLQQSLSKRALLNIPKKMTQPIAAYDFQQECQSIDEFNIIQHDDDRLYIEALLIRERILLPQKDKTLFPPLLERGIELVDQGQFDHCLQLWLHTFHLYQQMELYTDLQRFVWLFCQMLTAGVPIPVDQFLQICHLTFEPSQQKSKDEHITSALYLVAIAAKVLEQPTISSIDHRLILDWIQQLCREQRTTEESDRTLLHLSVSNQTYRHINFQWDEIQSIVSFPNTDATRLLLHCGGRWIDLDAVDRVRGDTALHIISRNVTDSNSTAIIELLINAGAHVDCVNNYDETPRDAALMTETRAILQSKEKPPRLKCLCARLITDQKLDYDRIWPVQTALNRFVLLHGDLSRKHSILDNCSSVQSFDFFHYDHDFDDD